MIAIVGLLFFNGVVLDHRTSIAALVCIALLFLSPKHIFPVVAVTMPIFVFLVSAAIGSLFAAGYPALTFGAASIKGTASNVERSIMAYTVLSDLMKNPLSPGMEEYTFNNNRIAQSIGRRFYSTDFLDPHNFVAFIFLKVKLFAIIPIVFLYKTLYNPLRFAHLRDRMGTSFIAGYLLSLVSFMPYSTEPRLSAALTLGLLMRHWVYRYR